MPLKITDNNFTRVMDIYGQRLKYYPGRLCSCVRENNGIPKVECGCNLGYWYEAPETCYGVRQQVNWKYLNTPQGRIFDGGAQFTIPKFYQGVEQSAWKRLAHGDIIVVDNKVRRETDILRKGVRDYLYSFDIQEILTVSKQNTLYVKDVDFTISGNTISWINGGNKPAEEEYYSVEFLCKQQFKVWEMGAQDRGTTEDELPRKILTVVRRYVDTETENPMDSFDYAQNIYEE